MTEHRRANFEPRINKLKTLGLLHEFRQKTIDVLGRHVSSINPLFYTEFVAYFEKNPS